MYLYECPSCGNVHDFDPNHQITHSQLPERYCSYCNEQGCADCTPDEGCEDCREDIDGVDDWREMGDEDEYDHRG